MFDELKPDGMKCGRLETVTYERPKCPFCGSIELIKTRSVHNQGDGSALWWVRCRSPNCGRRFKVLLE